MPNYEYECINGHRSEIKRRFSEYRPYAVPCERHKLHGEAACFEIAERIYSTFTFSMR